MNPDFYRKPTLELSKQLLGAELVHETKEGVLSGKIVEVEAYLGPEDRAAHSFGGRRTKRTEVMFGNPGHAYLYMIYGIHICLNIVSGPVGKPEAILLRAVEPIRGMERMSGNRGFGHLEKLSYRKRKQLTSGPGKLVKALDIPMDLYGHDMTEPPLYIRPAGTPIPAEEIAEGPRIGIENTGEAREYPYRFWIHGNPYV
ncbi:MAG TPA: DNA-3-methyladenine glycosylase [Bacillales bacterium]|nr:DNA-3-methyladenine glycosylase [Bacillales bacterium]